LSSADSFEISSRAAKRKESAFSLPVWEGYNLLTKRAFIQPPDPLARINSYILIVGDPYSDLKYGPTAQKGILDWLLSAIFPHLPVSRALETFG
jgi:hypothetical protein